MMVANRQKETNNESYQARKLLIHMEYLRGKMEYLADTYGLSDPLVLQASQSIDELLNKFNKIHDNHVSFQSKNKKGIDINTRLPGGSNVVGVDTYL